MNRDLVLAEWRRAWRALCAAEILAREGSYEDAVSRAYYATLHAAKAALYIHDVATTSHAGVRRMFGRHLIRSGAIEPMWASHLGESLDDRLAADYDVSTCFTSNDASQECQRTQAFLDRIRRYLLAQGFSDGELDGEVGDVSRRLPMLRRGGTQEQRKPGARPVRYPLR